MPDDADIVIRATTMIMNGAILIILFIVIFSSYLLTVSLNAILTTFGVPANFKYLATASADRPISRATAA